LRRRYPTPMISKFLFETATVEQQLSVAAVANSQPRAIQGGSERKCDTSRGAANLTERNEDDS
jgi:hypothetical protein